MPRPEPRRRQEPSRSRKPPSTDAREGALLDLATGLFEATDAESILRRLLVLALHRDAGGLRRAFLFEVDSESARLVGRHAAGPANAAEAARLDAARERGNGDGDREDAFLNPSADELESAAPEITADVRALSFPLAPEVDQVLDAVLEGRTGLFDSAVRGTGDAWREALGLRTFVASPVLAGGRAIALLLADHGYDGTVVSEADASRVSVLTRLAGHALERRFLARERADFGSRIASLEEAVRSAVTATSVRTELALLVRALAQTLTCRGAVLWRAVGPRQALVLETVHVAEERVDPLRHAEALEPFARTALRDRVRKSTDDPSGDPHLDPAAVRGFGALYATPIGPQTEPLGVLAVWGPPSRSPGRPPRFDREDERVIETLAGTAALVLAQSAISERVRRAEDRLRERDRELTTAERMATLGEMGARAALEARNPLASIGGFARRLHRGLPADDPNREYAEIILREADRLERILAEQIAFADLARPRLGLESVNQLLGASLSALSDRLTRKRVRLLKKLAPDVPALLLDAEKIRKVVDNMLDHSLEALAPNGRLRVESRRAHGYVVVEIASDGAPLAGDLLEQLFVPFATAQRTGETVGLALAQQIVQSHGGEIRVRSEAEWGVIFSFTLPVIENQDRRNRPDRRGQRRDRRNRFPAA